MQYRTQTDYLTASVLSADPIALVGYLFDGLLTSIREARTALHKGEILVRSRSITKGIEILGELSVALNRDANTQLTAELGRLYEYMIWKLTEANIHQTEAPLNEVERLAGSLAEAWRELGVGAPTSYVPSAEFGANVEHVSVLG